MRGARDADVVRFGAPGFHIAARTGGGARTTSCPPASSGRDGASACKLDGGEPPRLSDALGALPCVLFSPGDVELVAGAPSARRRYLDVLLALSSRPYLAALQRYRGALAQRNAALRDALRGTAARGRAARRRVGGAARRARRGAVARARARGPSRRPRRFAELCAAIGEQAPVRCATRRRSSRRRWTCADRATRSRAALEQKRALDMRRGLTHAGPHRDDLELALDGRELRAFGSAGQQRTAAIALRLLEAETLRERLGAAPLFLLDDPFAELDVAPLDANPRAARGAGDRADAADGAARERHPARAHDARALAHRGGRR